MTTFYVEITMDNEAMQDESDIRCALRNIIRKLYNHETSGSVRDDNGNKVGEFGYR